MGWFETLENRTLLSGNVTALLRAGDVIIRGDDEDNQIIISQTDSKTIQIEGVDGTLINGQESVDLRRMSDDLIVRMQDVEDDVEIQGPLTVPDSIQAELGDGSMSIEGSLGPLNVRGNVSIRTSAKGQAELLNNVKVGGNLSLSAGEVTIAAGRATQPNFAAARFDRSLTINNPYFPVVPGAVYTYDTEAVDDETGETTTERNVVEVLSTTLTIEGVQVRVVRDRVWREGLLVEDTHDYYGQDNNGNVWYFGEDVINNEYDDQGNLISTNSDGSWRAGEDDAQAGVLMEARPRIGHRYYQEFAPGNVLDQAVGIRKGESVTLPAGKFTNLFRTEENSVVEPLDLANKLYAPGVGTVEEFDLDIEDDEIIRTTRLISLTLNGQPVSSLVPSTGFKGTNAGGRLIGGTEISGETNLRAGGPIVINGAELMDLLIARSKDVIVAIDTDLNDATFSTEDTLSLRRVSSDGSVRVSGGLDDIYISGCEIDRFLAMFDRSDDSIIVKNSDFDIFNADGGAGRNTFDDAGGNEFGQLGLRRFQRV